MKSAGWERLRARSARHKFRRDGVRGTEKYTAWGQTSKHTSSTHTRAPGPLVRTRTHQQVKDSNGAANDWNDLHSMSNPKIPLGSLGYPPAGISYPSRIARRNRHLRQSGYLLRGRCRLNLINSMRHLDKCVPRTRIQRIIFILIHLPFPPFQSPSPPLFLSPSSTPPPLFSSRSPQSLLSRLPHTADARTVSSVIRSPIHTRQARASSEKRGRPGSEGEAGEKNNAFIRSHLAGVICLFDVAPYLIR